MKKYALLLVLPIAVALVLSFKAGKKEINVDPSVINDTILYPDEKHFKNIQQLTFGGDNAEAYFSYDGKWLIFQKTYAKEGIPCDQMYIGKIPTKKGEKFIPKLVSTGKGRTTCGAFMKDGKHIIYASTHLGSGDCPPIPDRSKYGNKYIWPLYDSYDIFMADLNGKIVKQLTNSKGYDAEATLSPDGKKMLYTSTKDGDIGNPTEISILRAAYFAGIDIDDLKTAATFVTEVPFSSGYKFMATVHHTVAEVDGPGLDDKYVVHAKGAPDRMIPLCKYQAKAGFVDSNMTEPIDSRYWIEQIAILSSHGLRVLALTRGTISKAEVSEGENLGPDFINGKGPWLTMVGLCAIIDPPRPECVEAIKLAHCAGVRVAMITGDHKDTAVAIGLMLGIVDEKFSEAVTGPEMDAMSDDELRKTVMSVNVFARASPENKIRIVKALQAEGQVASMTGDGVNDAPALKAADMGVAMGKEGTDVAREASEMILADDNFASIVAAVKEGRVVWENIRKAILINTAINNAQGLSVLFGYAFGLESTPLTAIQVLYSNLICATTLGFVCAVEPAEDGIMNVPPRRVGKRLIGRYIGLRIIIGTIILTGSVVASVFWVKDLGYDELQQRAQAFNVLDFGAVSITLSARFAHNSSFHPRVFQGNKYVNYSILFVIATQVFLTYVPYLNDVIFGMSGMDVIQWGICAFFTLIVFIVMECEMVVLRMLKAKHYDTSDQEEDFLDPKIEIQPEGSVLV